MAEYQGDQLGPARRLEQVVRMSDEGIERLYNERMHVFALSMPPIESRHDVYRLGILITKKGYCHIYHFRLDDSAQARKECEHFGLYKGEHNLRHKHVMVTPNGVRRITPQYHPQCDLSNYPDRFLFGGDA